MMVLFRVLIFPNNDPIKINKAIEDNSYKL